MVQKLSRPQWIKLVAKYFKCSSQAIVKLCTIQKQMGFMQLKLKLDIPTSWNLTLYAYKNSQNQTCSYVYIDFIISRSSTITHRRHDIQNRY